MTKEEFEIEFKKRQNRFIWLFALTILAAPLCLVNVGVAIFFGCVNLFYSIFLNLSARVKANDWYCENYEKCLGESKVSFDNLSVLTEDAGNKKNEFSFEKDAGTTLDNTQLDNSKAV